MKGRQANNSLFEAQNEAAAENTEVQGGEGRIRHWKEKTNHDYREKKATNRFTFWNPAMKFKIGIGGLAIQLINNLTCKAFSTFSAKFRRKLKFKALFKAVM